MKPSRKAWHTGAVLPGMLPAEQLDVCIAIDTSGSITDEMVSDFLGEVKGMLELYNSYTVKVFCFDTSVLAEAEFSSDGGDDILDYQPQGGGGTDFEVCWEHLKENDIVPKQFIMFTDGYPFGSWGDPNYCDTLFVIHGNDKIEAPFGVTAHYEFEKTRA
jgi:predicted metal-dependent peptidase